MFDTVAIEPQGRIQDSMFGGGEYLKHEIFSYERRRRARSHARAWGVVMNLAHFHTPKIIPTYTQGRSNEFESYCECFD